MSQFQEPLPIVALVGRYPANQLMGRTPILYRYKYLSSISHAKHGMHAVLILLSQGYPAVKGRSDTRYSPVRRSPSYLASQVHAAPRLACVKPVASVHPEPGSNSPLYILSSYFLQEFSKAVLRLSKNLPPCGGKIPTLCATLLKVYGNIFKDRFALFRTRSFPKASAKVQRIFLQTKHLGKYFSNFFLCFVGVSLQ